MDGEASEDDEVRSDCAAAIAVEYGVQSIGIGATVASFDVRWRGRRCLPPSSADTAELEAALLALEALSTVCGMCTHARLLGCSAALTATLCPPLCATTDAAAAAADTAAADGIHRTTDGAANATDSAPQAVAIGRALALLKIMPATVSFATHPDDGGRRPLEQHVLLDARIEARPDPHPHPHPHPHSHHHRHHHHDHDHHHRRHHHHHYTYSQSKQARNRFLGFRLA